MNRLSRRDFAAFWNEGYVVGDIGISDDLRERAPPEVEDLNYVPIFRDVYNWQRDQFRRQANVNPLGEAVGEMHAMIAEMLATIYTGLTLSETG
ncbi:hypothetical protein PF010_g17536 [Phytophthora fragariae]|uniref:Uncharacterized protein n=1 Tax=Phytophthora fragariae TaxID=53985 RepID=A0A6G0KMU9_9STRA|nr:hypothetical protein PF010_g17536 [Phytophthora fragariae]